MIQEMNKLLLISKATEKSDKSHNHESLLQNGDQTSDGMINEEWTTSSIMQPEDDILEHLIKKLVHKVNKNQST